MSHETIVNEQEILLREFSTHNPHSKIVLEDGNTLIIEKPWGEEDVRLCTKMDDEEFIQDLNQLRFHQKFDAILHRDFNIFEVVYGYIKENVDELDRSFLFIFENKEYKCAFANPTDRFLRLASHYEIQAEGDITSLPQITAFKDAQRIDKIPPLRQKYFEGRIPRNFLVTAINGFDGVNLEKLANHINFIMRYYDRSTPVIKIKQDLSANSSHAQVNYIEEKFPEACLIPHAVDDIILRLLDVASGSYPRFAFIYYYQVFEYSGYYYIDQKARSTLRNAFRDPSLICGSEDKFADLFAIFSDINQNDEVKIRKVIEEYCDPRVIWKEINVDRDFFTIEHIFDGGFVAQALIAKDTTQETWIAMWMPKTFDLLSKIRNVLVHAREKRENKIILPSRENNKILKRYLPIIRRIAEQLALKT